MGERKHFLGKEGGYAVTGPWSHNGYTVAFLGEGCMEYERSFFDLDSCILWAAYQEFVEGNTDIGHRNALICRKDTGEPVMWIVDRDSLLGYVRKTLDGVGLKDGRTRRDWLIFPAGTDMGEIQEWLGKLSWAVTGRRSWPEKELPPFPWERHEEAAP
ncbi:MAG: hypothetical protein NC489_41650 [Ruminococcus flavefaciens]|nr:hypothetical protein [Ruminococcus flavefaciens]